MSIEEKAKAYDEIIKKANKMHHENCEACQICIEELIPELAESKDEMIRKELIRVFSNREKYVINQSFGNINVSDILAWLEKQGEQKPTDVRTTGYWHVEDIEQNHAWSEEDNHYLCGLIGLIEQSKAGLPITFKGKAANNCIDWLKCLKERVQPKQEWSMYDETILKTLIDHFEYKKEFNEAEDYDIVLWLKSLRPQNRWKPSDEQITWLYRAADDATIDSRMKQILKELLSDLKKLREE